MSLGAQYRVALADLLYIAQHIRCTGAVALEQALLQCGIDVAPGVLQQGNKVIFTGCLLYTSDAADE